MLIREVKCMTFLVEPTRILSAGKGPDDPCRPNDPGCPDCECFAGWSW